MIKIPENALQNLNITQVQSYTECTDLNVLYSKDDKTFLYKFKIGEENFELSLQETQKGVYDISLISEKYGFADFEGLNMNIIGSILKKILMTLKNNKAIRTIEFKHRADFYTVQNLELARKYLKKNHNHSELGGSFTAEEMQNFTDLVRKDLLHHKNVEPEYLDLYNHLTENRPEKEMEGKNKRLKIFTLLLSRIFKNQQMKIEQKDTDIYLRLNH